MRTLELFRRVDRQRYRFHFCVLSGLPGELDEPIRALGGEIHYLPLNVTFPWRFRRLLREHRIGVVHSHVHYFSGYLLRLAAKEAVAVRVAHFRNTHDGYGKNIRRRLQRLVMRRWIDHYSTSILSVCEGAMEYAWGKKWTLDSRCRVVYNGLELSPFSLPPDRDSVRKEFDLPPDSRLYVHVGRMDPQKNHTRVMSIFAEIVRRDPRAYLLLIGRGGNQIEGAVREQAALGGLAARVRFAGERPDVPRLLKASDLLLFPSLWEGLPGAVLEACAAGLPVLASDLSGVKEIARYFPNVSAFSLGANDDQWASMALTAAGDSSSARHSRAEELFAKTPFTMRACVAALSSVWEGGMA
jgi:glycosyltransferase involved in cell wall biosynthesis